MPKYIFVAGGVMSGIGKGTTMASIGRILKDYGFKVTSVKIDPYVNVDAGTMNPMEHGEVFVTQDGCECDQDVGNYERFLDENLSRDNYMTTGLVYQTVITKERNLGYAGKCVEVVPHIPDEIIRRINLAAKKSKADFILIEIGGTVGEYQNLLFLEAGRMMKLRQPRDVLFVLVSYLPVPEIIGEMKTKPTQYAVRTLNSAGIQPDFIIARSVLPLDEPRKRKISIFCNMTPENIISAPDIKSIYEIPVNFEKEDLGKKIIKKAGLRIKKKKDNRWFNLVNKIQKINQGKKKVKIGIVGKYFETGNFVLSDSYISVIEAIKHAAYGLDYKPEISWLNAGRYQTRPASIKELLKFDGIIVPGGFGSRATEGKIKAINFVRKNKIPFLGLCFGLQLAVVEFARNVCGLKNADSTEINPKTKYPVIDLMPEQLVNLREKRLGGSMRLGIYHCKIKKGTIASRTYVKENVFERHRHRYEVNNQFRPLLEKKGIIISGFNPERNLVEIIELKNHPFFVATQFHPEFQSRPLHPHPLIQNFIKAATKSKKY